MRKLIFRVKPSLDFDELESYKQTDSRFDWDAVFAQQDEPRQELREATAGACIRFLLLLVALKVRALLWNMG